MTRLLALSALVGIAGTGAACDNGAENGNGGGNDAVDTGPPDGGDGPADVGPTDASDAGGGDGSPLYVFGIRIRLPDGTTTSSFLGTRESLDGLEMVTVDDGFEEFVGQQRYREVEGGMLLENADQPSITRFDRVGSELVPGETVSFSNFGFPAAGRTVLLADERAYNISFEDLEVATFDPVDMILESTETFQLPATEFEEGFSTNGVQTYQVGSLLYVIVAFADLADITMPRIDSGITVYVVDTETDTVEDIIVDDRCNHASGAAQTDNGDIYILGDNGFNVIRPNSEACIVRIRAGEREFDSDYLFTPSEVLGGRQTNDLVPLGGNLALTFPLYPEQLDPENRASILLDPVRKPWRLDLVNQTATEIEGAPFTKGTPLYGIEGELWIGTSDDFTETAVYAIDAQAATAELQFRTEGQLISLLEIE